MLLDKLDDCECKANCIWLMTLKVFKCYRKLTGQCERNFNPVIFKVSYWGVLFSVTCIMPWQLTRDSYYIQVFRAFEINFETKNSFYFKDFSLVALKCECQLLYSVISKNVKHNFCNSLMHSPLDFQLITI